MIKIPTKQSYKLAPVIFSLCLLISLISFFAYAFEYPRFFIQIIFGSTLCIGFLLILQYRLLRKQAVFDLEKQEYIEKRNLLEAEKLQYTTAIEAYRNKIIDYSHLKDLTEELSGCFTIEDTSRVLSAKVSRLFGHLDCTVILYLFNNRTGELGISVSQKGQTEINIKAKKGDMYDQWVIKNMQPLLLEDAKADFRFDTEKTLHEEQRFIRSLMSIPLMVGPKAVGIMRLDSEHESQFTTEDMRLLSTVTDLGAVAIENAQLYERVEEMAIKDSVTGLYLRRHMLERLSQELRRSLRRKQDLSFFMIDLDDFKKYNDTFGHSAGDIVLRAIGTLLTEKFGDPRDIICRYGGEEFSIVLPDCPKKKALELAEDLSKAIKKLKVVLRQQESKVTVSIGVATFPEDAQIKEELIQQADMALYEAKRKGKNRVVAAQTRK